jgi:hypothetical protein
MAAAPAGVWGSHGALCGAVVAEGMAAVGVDIQGAGEIRLAGGKQGLGAASIDRLAGCRQRVKAALHRVRGRGGLQASPLAP